MELSDGRSRQQHWLHVLHAMPWAPHSSQEAGGTWHGGTFNDLQAPAKSQSRRMQDMAELFPAFYSLC